MSAQEQLSFLEPVDEKEVKKAVVKALKEYKALRVAVQNKKERQEKGIDQLFPGLKKSESTNELKARQIERALQYSLESDHRGEVSQHITGKRYQRLS
jgi:hypothetical protein